MKKNFINSSIILFLTLISFSSAYAQVHGGDYSSRPGVIRPISYDYTDQIIYLIALFSMFFAGKAGEYFYQNFNFLKKISKINIIILYLILIVILYLGPNFSSFWLLSPILLAFLASLVRNKFNLKKIFDEKFYYFIFGILILAIFVTLVLIFLMYLY
jgi:hypothetical protein